MLKSAIELWKRGKNENGISLHRRLFVFFTSATVFIVLLFALLLIVFGVGGGGTKAIHNYTSGALSHIKDSVEVDFGKLSVQGVSYSENVAKNIDTYLKENGLPLNELSSYPSHLTAILSKQMDDSLGYMGRNNCTGAFILLDASVSPEKEFSRAGIFIKNTHLNSVEIVSSGYDYLRGPAKLARDNNIDILGQWKMEFDIEGEDFWDKVMATARENDSMPLSRLYYYTECFKIKGNSESSILLLVPIRSENGTVYGVGGFEVSDMMFKQRYTPNEGTYKNVFSLIAPKEENIIKGNVGLIAGNYFLTADRMETPLNIDSCKGGICYYSNNDTSYGGVHDTLKLYPDNSPYKENEWVLSVMMPKSVISEEEQGVKNVLLAIVIVLLLVSLVVSVLISKRYLKPVTEALDSIKTKSYSGDDKKNTYMEINDLMDFLKQQEKVVEPQCKAETVSMFDEFKENLKTLSRAERMVFDKYLEGLKAQDIAEELHLSINTIKTHNRRIFAKLNVSTRKELMVYVEMMKETNRVNGSDKS